MEYRLLKKLILTRIIYHITPRQVIIIMAQFIKGERGGNKVVYNGYIYKKKYSKNVKDYYQCDDDQCTVPLHMQRNTLNVVFYNGNGQHRHGNPDDKIALSDVMEEMKRRIDTDPTKHLPKMWEEVMGIGTTNYTITDLSIRIFPW